MNRGTATSSIYVTPVKSCETWVGPAMRRPTPTVRRMALTCPAFLPDHLDPVGAMTRRITEREGLVSKRSIMCAVVLAGLAAGMLAGCTSPVQRGSTAAELPGEKTVGSLRVGGYNYVAACNVFRRDDVESITHASIAAVAAQNPRLELDASYATGTYHDSDPYRVYISECAWPGTPADSHGTTMLELEQYPTAERLQLGLRFPGRTDEKLSKALGGAMALVDEDGTHFAAVFDNKIAKLSVAGESFATPLLQAVQRRLREVANKPSPPLDVSRAGGTVAGRPYLSACRLFAPADFTQVLGQTGDEGDIRAEVPVIDIPANPKKFIEVQNTCQVRRIPDKSPPGVSAEAAMRALSAEALLVEVKVVQTQDPADASQLVRGREGQRVAGLGDEAYHVISTGGVQGDDYLIVRRGVSFVELRVMRIKGASLTYEGLDTLRKVAAIAVPRMG